MMVTRDRSGRSGPRRGSQKPGTAIGSEATAGVFGTPGPTVVGGGPNCRGVWACATEAAPSSATIAHARPQCRHLLNFIVIRWSFPGIGRTISSSWRSASHIRVLLCCRLRARQTPCDLMHRHFDEILVDLRA